MSNRSRPIKPLSDEEEAKIQGQIASDPDNPELSEEEFENARLFREILPGLAGKMEKEIAARGRPRLEQTKLPVTIRLDQDVIDKFKATGKGWQGRINDVLKQAKI